MKKIIHSLSLYLCLAALGMMSCSNVMQELPDPAADKQLSPEAELSKKFMASYGSGITGETTVAVKKDPQLSPANSARINWGTIEKQDGGIRYLALGGSLAAGVRDGGLYREGQLTSYPNLIANQLGIRDFKQPLFSEEEGNGGGYKVLVKAKPVLEYSLVKNNLALKTGEPYGFEKQSGSYDNLGIAFGGGIYMALTTPAIFPYSFGNSPYLYRVLKEGSTGYFELIEAQEQLDFFTMESPVMQFLNVVMNGGYGNRTDIGAYNALGYRPHVMKKTATSFKAKGAKWGLILNIPEVLDFPYFNLYSPADVKRLTGTEKLQVRYTESILWEVNDSDRIIPNEYVLNLLRNGKAGFILRDEDVLREDEYLSPQNLNEEFVKKVLSEESGYPVVDLYSLFKKITAGQYVTHDGVQVDPTFPTGNFFSSDGINPTAFGQAVIANECIRVLNDTYKANVELISTRQFLNIVQ